MPNVNYIMQEVYFINLLYSQLGKRSLMVQKQDQLSNFLKRVFIPKLVCENNLSNKIFVNLAFNCSVTLRSPYRGVLCLLMEIKEEYPPKSMQTPARADTFAACSHGSVCFLCSLQQQQQLMQFLSRLQASFHEKAAHCLELYY